MAPWPVRVARALDRDENSRVIVENLDQVIRWITGRPSDATSAMDFEIEKLGLEPGMARTRALIIINRMMLRRQDPWSVLGVRRGTDVSEVRIRYKRLMQVFHPDRGFADTDWLSDCTARLHWAHDVIRNAPIGKSGFSAGFGKRQRSKPKAPPPWREQDPMRKEPTLGENTEDEREDEKPIPTAARGETLNPETASDSDAPQTTSGVWRFPGGGASAIESPQPEVPGDAAGVFASGGDAPVDDAEYLQARARQTTESVVAPEYVTELGGRTDHIDGDFDYDAVFQQSIETNEVPAEINSQLQDAPTAETRLVEDADIDDVIDIIDDANDEFIGDESLELFEESEENFVDVFEQAAPTTADHPSATRASIDPVDIPIEPKHEWSVAGKSQSDQAPDLHSDVNAITVTDAGGDAKFESSQFSLSRTENDEQRVEERLVVERTNEAPLIGDRVRVLADKDRKRALREKIEREKTARKNQLDVRLKKEQERQAKIDEKARRKVLRRESSLEKKRLKELKRQEKIQRKQLELHQQRNDVEAAEQTRREERQRARAEAKERAEAQAERRRLQQLDNLHREEAEAVAAQRAREAQRRRRHLEAEGNRLSSISDRSSTERPPIAETTLPPWHERARELSRRHHQDDQAMDRRARIERRADLEKQVIEQWQAAESKSESAGIAARTVRASNVEPLRSYRQSTAPSESTSDGSGRGETSSATAQRRVQRISTSRSRPRTSFESGPSRDNGARLGEGESTRVKHAANDDTVGTPSQSYKARYTGIALALIGLIGIFVFVGQKITTGNDDGSSNEVAVSSSVGTGVQDQVVSVQTAMTPAPDEALVESGVTESVEPTAVGVSSEAQTSTLETVVAQDVVLANTEEAKLDSESVGSAVSVPSSQSTLPLADSDITTERENPIIDTMAVIESAAVAEESKQRAATTVASDSLATGTVAATGIQTRQELPLPSNSSDDITSLIRGIPVSRDTKADVQAINDLLRNSYIDGDASAFASLFSADGVMNEYQGASTIEAALDEIFQGTDRRHLYIEVARIDELSNVYSLHGRLSTVLRFDDGTSKLTDSNLRMSIAAQNNRLVIQSLSY